MESPAASPLVRCATIYRGWLRTAKGISQSYRYSNLLSASAGQAGRRFLQGNMGPGQTAAAYAATSASASTMPSTTSSTSALSSPSPMTRITGSVPEGRIDEAAMAVETLFGVLDGGADIGVFERFAALVADVLEHLRQRVEAVADLGYRLALLLHHRQHLQRGDEAVARGGVVRQDDVAGLLAAEVVAVLAHLLEHVAVADRGAGKRDAEPLRDGAPARNSTSPCRRCRGLARRPSSLRLSAMTARSWSPSTIWPRSSTMITRSASPSSAMPMSARISLAPFGKAPPARSSRTRG